MTDRLGTSDLTSTIDTYLEAYGEPDRTRRAHLIARVFAVDGRLVDPPLEASGHGPISDMVDVVLDQFAGHHFRRTSSVDEHHGVARYRWDLVAPDGSVALAGTDIVDVDAGGRITRVVGFFGDVG